MRLDRTDINTIFNIVGRGWSMQVKHLLLELIILIILKT